MLLECGVHLVDVSSSARAAAPADTRRRLTSFRGDVLAQSRARSTRSLGLTIIEARAITDASQLTKRNDS